MEEQNDDTFLARWLSNELSEAELATFEKSEEFAEYSKIVNTVDTAVIPEFDVDTNFKATLQKIEQQKSTETTTKVKRLIPSWAYAAAASVVVAFFGYMYFFNEITHTTQYAEQYKFELPDGSKVHLNADSEITYKRFNWNSDKNVQLKGEAFFNVKKGAQFSVKTSQGKVDVLGTSFTVKDRKNFYNVVCYTGKVAVTTKNETTNLTKGEEFIILNNESKKETTTAEEPSWLAKQSTFDTIDIREVVNELERQYNITINGKENLKSANYSGRFTHTNLRQAAKTVFLAMDIPYTLDKQGNLTIKKY